MFLPRLLAVTPVFSEVIHANRSAKFHTIIMLFDRLQFYNIVSRHEQWLDQSRSVNLLERKIG